MRTLEEWKADALEAALDNQQTILKIMRQRALDGVPDDEVPDNIFDQRIEKNRALQKEREEIRRETGQ